MIESIDQTVYELNLDKVGRKNVGEVYWFRNGVEKGFFGRKFYTYFNEQFIDNKLQFLINETNSQPCAFQTNDSIVDGFNTYTYARMVVYVNMTIAVCRKTHDKIDILFFKVIDCDTSDNSTENRIKVKLIRHMKSIHDKNEPSELTSALVHARKFFNSRLYKGRAQLVDRFSMNPHRIFEIHLYTENDFGVLYSHRANGTTLMLSHNAEDNEVELYDKNAPIVMRTFHRKSKENVHRLTVDGIRLQMMHERHIPDYFYVNGQRHNLFKVFIKGYKKPVYGINNFGNKIRLIYRIGDRFRSFLLNDFESSLIERIEKVNYPLK